MLEVSEDNSIRLTRGDTARFSVSITNDVNKQEYTMQEGDILTLSIKKSINDETLCLQLIAKGEASFYIKPKDTSALQFGKYIYDVQLTTAAGDVYTIIEPTTFELSKEVTT